jgi:hypothetical protein
VLKRILKTFLASVGVLLFATLIFHLAYPPMYRFPPARAFSGKKWYNPYAGITGQVERRASWLKANFHAHSRAWGGFTRWGKSYPTEEVFNQYEKLGYDVIGISDYQKIRPPMPDEKIYIPTYEHGFGIFQQHQTVLGSKGVSWLDFPLYQGVRQKQCVINHLGDGAHAVILNHPNKNGSYSLEDLASLTGYTGIEIATKYARGTRHWDTALSAGRPVWGFCGDDRNDLKRLAKQGTAWIMIRSARRTPDAVYEALKAGRFYGVWARQDRRPNKFVSCRLRDQWLEVKVEEPADSIRFIGQAGTVKGEVKGVAGADYQFGKPDTYIRVEVETRATTLFLNPVFRYKKDPFEAPKALEAPFATSVIRLFAGVIVVLALFFGGWYLRSRLTRYRKKKKWTYKEDDDDLPYPDPPE